MRWLKTGFNSIYGLLGKTAPATEPADAFRTEAVRQMMLDTLTGSGLQERHPLVFRKITYAADVQALWYTRSDLMTTLASERGETFAREKMAAISRLFDGLLPTALKYSEPRTFTQGVKPPQLAGGSPGDLTRRRPWFKRARKAKPI